MRGTVHGGLLLTLADVALGYTAAFSEEPALSLTTANIPADFAGHAGLLDDGSVDHFWPEDKATWLEELMRRMGFRRDEAVAVGDSFLDVPMFGVVGQAIYVGSTVPLGVHAIHVPDGDIYQIARGIVGGPRA